jgi:hypothetical protein
MQDGPNRRRSARLACMLVVEYRPGTGAAAFWRPASVLDLTLVGCRLRVGEDLASGSPVALRFDALLEDGVKSTSIDASATVLWCRVEGLSRQVGLKFAATPAGLNEILGALGSR